MSILTLAEYVTRRHFIGEEAQMSGAVPTPGRYELAVAIEQTSAPDIDKDEPDEH